MPDPNLKWDVFVSYAHVDDREGWVERFHKQLSILLDQLGGRAGEIQIWRDPKLDEATIFDTVIQDRLEHSAVFLALCSNGYRRSDYCHREFEAFRQHYGDAGLRAKERLRIVRVRLQNLPYDALPGTADRTGAFDFFTKEGDDDIGTRLETSSPEFRAQMDRLSKTVFKILQDLGGGQGATRPEPVPGDVFLAEVCDSQRKALSRLTADLTERGVKVAAHVPPPFAAAEHEDAVRSVLERCKLGVHLFDAWGDNPVQGRDATTYGREQLRLGRERKLPQLVWIAQRVPLGPAAPNTSLDASWIEFLNELESAPREEDEYRIVRCPPSELASVIEKRIAELSGAPAQRPAVLLDTHARDQLVAYDVCKVLLTSGVRPDLIAQEDDPRQNTTLFAEHLRQARGLLVLFGQASEQWVRARLDEGRKLMVSAPGALRFCGVLLAPPNQDKDPAAFEHPLFKTHVLDIREGLNPAALVPVLQGLGVH